MSFSINLSSIPLNTIFSIECNPTLNDDDVYNIESQFLRIVSGHIPNYHELDVFNGKLPSDWKWCPTVTKTASGYNGSLLCRLTKLAKKQYDFKMTDEQKQLLGSTISRYNGTTKNVYLEITDRFDWSGGDFGDDGSCFFYDPEDRHESHNRHRARECMRKAGTLAFRIWTERRNNSDATVKHNGKTLYGCSRSWITVTPFGIISWNHYGHTYREQIRFLTMLLESQLGVRLFSSSIKVTNQNTTQGAIYVNNSGSCHVLHLEGSTIPHSYDLNIKTPKFLYCRECEKHYYEDEDGAEDDLCPDCVEQGCCANDDY